MKKTSPAIGFVDEEIPQFAGSFFTGTKDMIWKVYTKLIAASIPAEELFFIKGDHFVVQYAVKRM